jgi:hypothetical protein
MAYICAPHDNRLQRTIMHKLPTHMRQRAAAEPERYAAFDAARAFLARWPLSAKNRTFDYGKKWAST